MEPMPLVKLSVLAWSLYNTCSATQHQPSTPSNGKRKGRLNTSGHSSRSFSCPHSQCSFRGTEFISLRNKLLGSWLNELQGISCCPHTTVPPPNNTLEPQNCSAAERTKISQWGASYCRGRSFSLSTKTMVGSECEEQQINWGIALPFKGRSSTFCPQIKIMVQFLPQPQPTSLLLLWWDQRGPRNYVSVIKIRGFLIILRWCYRQLQLKVCKTSVWPSGRKRLGILHDCHT